MRADSKQHAQQVTPAGLPSQGEGGVGGAELAAGRTQGLAREVAAGPLLQLPRHQAAVSQTPGPQSCGAGLHLELPSTGDGRRLGNHQDQGSEAPEDPRGAGWAPQAGSAKLPRTP